MGDELGDGSGDRTGDGTGDEQMMRGEELGDEVREVGIWCMACWVWRACGGVLSDRNREPIYKDEEDCLSDLSGAPDNPNADITLANSTLFI